MKYLIDENFKDFPLAEFPYDKFHTALGEYHHIEYDGYKGNFYDPICLHQWRTLDGSWIVTSDGNTRYMEQNRGDSSTGAFKNVYATLVHKQVFYSTYALEFNIRLFEINNYAGMAFSYITSRNYYAVGINGTSIALFRRNEEEIEIIDSIEIPLDDTKTYNIKVSVGNTVYVYLDNKMVLKGKINFKLKTKVALIAKSMARYSNIRAYMTDYEYKDHIKEEKIEAKRLDDKRCQIPQMKLIKKINLGNIASARQLRIAKVDNDVIFVFAQHQKKFARDSFANISSLSAINLEGKILWTIGEACNSPDNTLISCDLPFQIADINNDGKLELIYAKDFEINIIDLLTAKPIKKFNTLILKDDPLVKNNPYYRLNVDAIRVADFKGLGYKGDFIIKDRYQNVWAMDYDFNILFRYHNKNTGHFPYIFDYNNDGKDEMFVGYDLVDSNGNIIFDLPMNSDHTDEIIYARLNKEDDYKFVLASGNEGVNIINRDGTIYKHNEIGHAQRVSIAPYDEKRNELLIFATSFWGGNGIIKSYNSKGEFINEFEMESNGSVITPINYDGKHILSLLHAGKDGGLIDSNLDKVLLFPDDNHPTLCVEGFDIDGDEIDEILVWDLNELWIYKSSKCYESKKYDRYPSNSFSNYRGEYLIPDDFYDD